MNLWQYIQGSRKGKEAHEIEKEAMKDPFLADALAGYETSRGNPQKEVARLQKEIVKRQKRTVVKTRKKSNLNVWGTAAGLLLVVAASAWYYLQDGEYVQHIFPREKNEKITAAIPLKEPEREIVSIPEPQEIVPEPQEAAPKPQEAAPKPQEAAPKPQETAPAPEEKIVSPEKKDDTEVATPPAKETAKVDTITSPKPQPVVGMTRYQEYLSKNMIRPTDDECRNAKGAIIVTLKVGQSGRPYNIRVAEGLCDSSNKEAIRLIINGPDWQKGTETDEATVTINF